MQRSWFKATSVLLLLLLVAIVTTSPTISYSASTTYYAGYYYYASESWPPPNGVSAAIYTIDKSVSGENFYCQWPTVILSYTNGYWIQVGYFKGYHSGYQLKFYVEKKDSGGHQLWWKTSPTAGKTYGYYLFLPRGTTVWKAGVSGKFEQELQVSPFTARDYQAFSEMTTKSINIDGTHFTSICYALGTDWRFWDRHVPGANSPYEVIEISHYEFKARGGG